MMTHLLLAIANLLFLSHLSPASTLVDQGKRPNLILVISDDQRYDTLSATGNPCIQTPNLDRLAQEGALFESAFVTCSRCCPSRATILTGMYLHRHGVHSNAEVPGFLERQTSFAAVLQQSGYETAFIGKWHINDNDPRPRPGFDHWVGFHGQGQEARQGSYFDQQLLVDGSAVESTGFSADILTDFAEKWIHKQRQRPFLLILSFKNCHRPFHPPDYLVDQVDRAKIALPESLNQSADSLPTALQLEVEQRRYQRFFPDGEAAYADEYSRYLALVLSIDQSVQRLRRALEDSDQLDQTLFMVASDGGFLWGEHGLFSKGPPYEPSIRIPLLVRYGREIKPGTRITNLVLDLDIAPTMLEVAGVEVPRETQGSSLRSLWLDGDRSWREDFLYFEPFRDSLETGPVSVTLRSERWKLTRYRSGSIEDFLFDLRKDPEELENVASSPENKSLVQRLHQQIEQHLAAIGAPMGWANSVQKKRDRLPWKIYADSIVEILDQQFPATRISSTDELATFAEGVLLQHEADLRESFPSMSWSTLVDTDEEPEAVQIIWHVLLGKRGVSKLNNWLQEDWGKGSDPPKRVLFVVYDPDGWVKTDSSPRRGIYHRDRILLRFLR
jgi:N-acetylglucosamine-6-sulfatase